MKTYLIRLGELVAVAFVGGVVESLRSGGWSLSHAALAGALTAGVMAVYGLLAKQGGGDPQRPTLK
ncbi:hypothetical protein [Streptomyces sp. NPDC059009]|uniref:hypothetical protein n=1 Tax=Streptomyces sp. NPDC059009 TaxID=3346694 RepID=UPI0036995C27